MSKWSKRKQRARVVMFSGGVGSWATAKRVAERFGTKNLILLFADTKMEDEDLYRFLDESAENVGGELVKVADGRDPWQVFFDVKYLGNTRIDPCSLHLKRKLLRKWIEENLDPERTTIYLGIDWTEEHRFVKAQKYWEPWKTRAPMCRPPYVDKDQMLQDLIDNGIQPPRLYEMGFPHNNPLAGETEVITAEGTKPISELAGRNDIYLMTRRGRWIRSEVRAFGEQPLLRITLRRNGREKVVRSTPDHRWFRYVSARAKAEKEVRADELRAGDRLVSVFEQYIDVNLSPQGVQHGIVYGDGTRPRYRQSGRERWNPPAWVTLCGEKDAQLLKWFPHNHTRQAKDVGIVVTDLPHHFKDPPPLSESRSYLLGWLAGYIAADGSVDRHGMITLHSADYNNVRLARDICHIVGLRTLSPRRSDRVGYGAEPSALWSLPIFSYPEQILLLDGHRARGAGATRKASRWEVIDVQSDPPEEVFCAIVPETHCFVLEDNILTGNCGGFCIKAGMAHFKLLYEQMPERYHYHEKKEQELQRYLDKNVTILRDRRGGTVTPLSLKEFRARIDAEGSESCDPDEWGGCGCFSPDEYEEG